MRRALDAADIELVKLMVMGEGLDLDDALAVHYAVQHCNRDVVKALLELGAADIMSSEDSLKSLSLDYLNLLINGQAFSDVAFSVEGRLVHAHRCVLAARSLFFRKLFCGLDPNHQPPPPPPPLNWPMAGGGGGGSGGGGRGGAGGGGGAPATPELVIPVSSIRYEVLVLVLQFLYSGQASVAAPKSGPLPGCGAREAAGEHGEGGVGGRRDEGADGVAQALLELGAADVNSRAGPTGKTALHLAAEMVSPDMVSVLLDHHADPNSRTLDGVTPLDVLRSLTSEFLFKGAVPGLTHIEPNKLRLCLELVQSAVMVTTRDDGAPVTGGEAGGSDGGNFPRSDADDSLVSLTMNSTLMYQGQEMAAAVAAGEGRKSNNGRGSPPPAMYFPNGFA
uniref:BTB domain-containing protein n=1 Tax=Oryza rufipogon TaxID=4529 RepID=A0A0E0R417_ORYRU